MRSKSAFRKLVASERKIAKSLPQPEQPKVEQVKVEAKTSKKSTK